MQAEVSELRQYRTMFKEAIKETESVKSQFSVLLDRF